MNELDLYTPATLTHAVNLIKPENRFLTKVLMPGRSITSATESVMFDVERERRDLAPMGHNGDPATKVNMDTSITTMTVTPPQILLNDPIHASEVGAIRLAGQSPVTIGSGQSGPVVSALNVKIAQKQKRMVDAVSRRIEWMFSQVASTGVIDYTSPNGRRFTIDFGVPSGNLFDLTEKWDASSGAGDPLVQLPQLMRTFADQNGMNPSVFVMGTAAADAFRANPHVKAWLKSAGIQLLQINEGNSADLVTPVATIPGVGTLVEYSATYPSDTTGAPVPYIPTDRLVLTHPSLWQMHYGAIVDFDLGDNPVLMAERFSKIKVSPDGKTRDLYVESHPLPVIVSDTSIMVVKVCG